MITAITVHVDVMSEFPAQDGDDMTDMGDTDGDDWMNVSRSHCLSAHFLFKIITMKLWTNIYQCTCMVIMIHVFKIIFVLFYFKNTCINFFQKYKKSTSNIRIFIIPFCFFFWHAVAVTVNYEILRFITD